MALVLDTSTLARSERSDAFREAMQTAGIPARLTLPPAPDGAVRAKLELWTVGRGSATLLQRASTGIHLTRTAKHLRVAAPERVALVLLTPGAWTYHQHGVDHGAGAEPRLLLVDHSAPYEFARHDTGTTIAFNIDRSDLDLPEEVVADAVRRLTPASPLHTMAREHLQHLARVAASGAPVLEQLEATSTALVRALVVTTGHDRSRLDEVLDQTLSHRIRQFIVKNLTDPDLSPDQIARAHHISVRHLYKIWSRSHVSLSQWIIHQRLERAHDYLAHPRARTAPIAVISAEVGFSDPTHFTRRFKDAYGITPREWRAQSLTASTGLSSDRSPEVP